MESPPHARGWTSHSYALYAFFKVSPARAGMDPHFQARRTGALRLPRTRGDGPAFTAALLAR